MLHIDIENAGRIAEILENSRVLTVVAFIVIWFVVKTFLDNAIKKRN